MTERIQVYEYVTAQGAKGIETFAPSLLREGRAMRDAIVIDLRAAGFAVEELAEIPARIDALGTLVIAPESDGILERLSNNVLNAGGRLLGSTPEAIHLTADKLLLAHHLADRGIATPPILDEWSDPGPWVLKPRDGAGSQDTYLIQTAAEHLMILAHCTGEMILQPFVPGVTASVAFLIGPTDVIPLLPCSQELSKDGRFHYQGGMLPLPRSLRQRAIDLASQAVQTVNGLRGYVGVDLVLGETDSIIEINPRLTTSYLGLRRAFRGNLAAAMLEILSSRSVVWNWDETPRRFTPDGTSYLIGE